MTALREAAYAVGHANGVEPSDADVDRLLVAATKAMAERLRAGREALPDCHGLTATDAVTVSSALLGAVNVEVFELALWQSWGGCVEAEVAAGE